MIEFEIKFYKDPVPQAKIFNDHGKDISLWFRSLSEPNNVWFCTRPKGHNGAHETGAVFKPRAYWYTDSGQL